MQATENGKLLLKMKFENDRYKGMTFGEILEAVEKNFPNIPHEELKLEFSGADFALIVEKVEDDDKLQNGSFYITSPPRTLAYIEKFLAKRFSDPKKVEVSGVEDSGLYDYLVFCR